MKLITKNDIQIWGQSFDAKGVLPLLVCRLVRAITPPNTFAEFPHGSGVFIEGWDGNVRSESEYEYVPKGTSLWEFGTEASVTTKANKDYEKRTKNPLGENPAECTFIFLTPRIWKDKTKWQKEKQKEGIWKDVRAYDSRNIAEWFDLAPAVAWWFGVLTQNCPADGVLGVDRFWLEWTEYSRYKLPPEILISGREQQAKQLQDFLNGDPAIRGIKAPSKDEAIAFVVACAKKFETNDSDYFFSRSLIIDTAASFRSASIRRRAMNLISKIEEKNILYAGVADGNHVLVPMGPDDTFNQEIIDLPPLARDGQIAALVSMGLNEEDAATFSLESGRNVTVLKRLLKFPDSKYTWLTKENPREFIPALLLGRWNEHKKGDKELIEFLSGESYDDYLIKLHRWRDMDASPIIQIGNTWRLTSPVDAWTNLSSYITKSDLNSLEEAFEQAYKNGNPPVDREGASILSKYVSPELTFSNWSREGICQSLILIAVFGKGLKIAGLQSPQDWVDTVVSNLLSEADGNLWISIYHELPLFAEASPEIFLDSVEFSLSQTNKPIMDLFIEEQGMLSKTSKHTGLLWALEGLAWMPEYIGRASLVLSKLAGLDPGGDLSNRPINSLVEIFRPWHYQTLGGFDDRMDSLTRIMETEPDVGWTLLLKLLPNFHSVAHPSHKMRWRTFGNSYNQVYTYEELFKTHSHIVDILIKNFDYSENKLSKLIEKAPELRPGDREKILDFAEGVVSKVSQETFVTWHEIRGILAHHRSHPETDWALSEDELSRIQSLYDILAPREVVNKYKWLFDDHWPQFEEGYVYDEGSSNKRHLIREQRINKERVNGVKAIIGKYGIDKIIELSKAVKQPFALGDILGQIVEDETEILHLVQLLDEEGTTLQFIQSFLFRKTFDKGLNWIFSLFEKLSSLKFSNRSLGRLFTQIPQSKELWTFIEQTHQETKEEYWKSMTPWFYKLSLEEKILGIEFLVTYKRLFTAVDVVANFVKDLPTDLITKALEKSVTVEAIEAVKLDGYDIDKIFKELDQRNDIDRSTLIRLEWLFLHVLASYGNNRKPILLHEELARDPLFFIQVLKWAYRPKSKELVELEKAGLSDEVILNRALSAYELLHSWKKIPGFQKENNSIDKDFLNEWVEVARREANEADRLEVADMVIGQVLAQYPEHNLDGPPDSICAIIEKVNTDSIKRNYSAGLFNKRGSSSRRPFDGGDIERGHAEYFEKLASRRKAKFPKTAKIFSNLAKGYRDAAKREDDRAEREKLEY